MDNNMLWYWLTNIDGIGQKKINKLMEYFPSVEYLYECTNFMNIKIDGISEKDIKSIKESKNIENIIINYNKLYEKGIMFIGKEHMKYPHKLRNIYDAPYGLYCKGNLPKENEVVIAIIGSRNCSDYGREVAENFAYELGKQGVSTVSGLALGVDGYAHSGSLLGGGITYAVLGSGIDICYPKENFNQYMNIPSSGGILSEYGLGVSPKPGFFPMRNRIISGLSDGILVIEAKEKSGSLITVDYGLDQGKNIYSIPGRIGDKNSEGCNNLIKMGAKLVTEPSDIYEDFSVNFLNNVSETQKIDNLLESKEKIVYACLSLQGKHVFDLCKETNLEISELTNIIIKLELDNYIKEIRPNYYVYCK